MRIAVHAFDGITMFHLATPLAVFGEVSRRGLADWDTVVWSEESTPVRSAEGLRIADLSGPDVTATADVLVFPSWPLDPPRTDDRMTELIRTAHERGAMIVGLCLGTFPVAHSGILDGRTAVTHWARAARLADENPSVEVQAAALYIDHGDVLTSAGTASALDACLHLVRTRLGSDAATAVARHLVIAPHRDGDQAQYVERPLPSADAEGPISEVIDWALTRLDQPLSVDDLAQRARMSSRNFARRFRETTGTSPAKWVNTRRLDEARRMLETSTWPISRIADACGFASAVTFRQNFVTAYATTPTAYRRHFNDAANVHHSEYGPGGDARAEIMGTSHISSPTDIELSVQSETAGGHHPSRYRVGFMSSRSDR